MLRPAVCGEREQIRRNGRHHGGKKRHLQRERASCQMSQLLRDVSAATSRSESICLSDVDLPD